MKNEGVFFRNMVFVSSKYKQQFRLGSLIDWLVNSFSVRCRLTFNSERFPGTQNRRATRHVLARITKCIVVDGGIFENVLYQGPPLWSSSQEFLATDPEIPGSIPGAATFSEK
jgi:hypothetical protein